MRKKILIVIILSTLILLSPFTSVIGASDNDFIKNVKGLKRSNLVLSKFIFKIARKMVNKINLLFGHYPEIADICKNITQTLEARNPILCAIFFTLFFAWVFFMDIVEQVLESLGIKETLIGQSIIAGLGVTLMWIGLNMALYCIDETLVNSNLSSSNLVNIKNHNSCLCIQ